MSEEMKPRREGTERILFTQTFVGATLVLILGGALGGVALWFITGQHKQISESRPSDIRATQEENAGVGQTRDDTLASPPVTTPIEEGPLASNPPPGEHPDVSPRTDWQVRPQIQDAPRQGAASNASPQAPNKLNDGLQEANSPPQAAVADVPAITNPEPIRDTDVFVFYTSKNEEAAFRLEELLVGAGLEVEVEQEVSRRVGFNRLVYSECAAEAATRIRELARPEVRLTTVRSVGPCTETLTVFLEATQDDEN